MSMKNNKSGFTLLEIIIVIIQKVLFLGYAKRDEQDVRVRRRNLADDGRLLVAGKIPVSRTGNNRPGKFLGAPRQDLVKDLLLTAEKIDAEFVLIS